MEQFHVLLSPSVYSVGVHSTSAALILRKLCVFVILSHRSSAITEADSDDVFMINVGSDPTWRCSDVFCLFDRVLTLDGRCQIISEYKTNKKDNGGLINIWGPALKNKNIWPRCHSGRDGYTVNAVPCDYPKFGRYVFRPTLLGVTFMRYPHTHVPQHLVSCGSAERASVPSLVWEGQVFEGKRQTKKSNFVLLIPIAGLHSRQFWRPFCSNSQLLL